MGGEEREKETDASSDQERDGQQRLGREVFPSLLSVWLPQSPSFSGVPFSVGAGGESCPATWGSF